ncbi:MOSC domain-containing protein [Haloprofundus halobius]|uniref:MOSC domain-containing protein n=1 Tax=Haloprofundus halobius TaxID=2876194 RepID=UPI001CCF9938|nr:MOSC domain-containing protein [Haloprofundus halobius]
MAHVETIFIATEDSAPMEELDSVDAVEDGLSGDRYQTGRGYYSPYDVCEVTLIEGEAIDEIREEFDIDLTDGRHRRNIVTRGVEGHDLLHTTFRVGDALLRGTRPRPPCAHVEQVADEEGVARALKNRRGGICADVVEPGTIRAGDELEVVEEDPQTMGRKIAERLGL